MKKETIKTTISNVAMVMERDKAIRLSVNNETKFIKAKDLIYGTFNNQIQDLETDYESFIRIKNKPIRAQGV